MCLKLARTYASSLVLHLIPVMMFYKAFIKYKGYTSSTDTFFKNTLGQPVHKRR